MPLEKRSAEEAFAGITRVSRYPAPKRDGHRYLPHPDVEHKPQFKISRTDKILTIGSCFARNIERALRQLDLNVLSSYVDGLVGQENIANKYTSKSILDDLRMALSDTEPTNEVLGRTIYTNDKGMARNLAFGGAGSVGGDSLDEVLDKSRKFYDNLSKVREADLIIITFGLIETWYDEQNGCYLNIPPSRGEIKKDPGRFSLHVLSYDDVRADMQDIFNLINEHGKKGVQILSTISPVPLSNTFRNQDCLQANCYSKAVQRAAIEEVLATVDNAHYFPSYEMVTLASPEIAWIDTDYRHPLPDTIDRIMRKVISSYIDPNLLPPLKKDLKRLAVEKGYQEITEKIQAYLDASGKEIEDCATFIPYYMGVAAVELGNVDEGLKLIRLVLKDIPTHPNANKILAKHS